MGGSKLKEDLVTRGWQAKDRLWQSNEPEVTAIVYVRKGIGLVVKENGRQALAAVEMRQAKEQPETEVGELVLRETEVGELVRRRRNIVPADCSPQSFSTEIRRPLNQFRSRPRTEMAANFESFLTYRLQNMYNYRL
jgi:hypothetical protein